MALDLNNIRFIAEAVAKGVKLGRVVTLGRLGIWDGGLAREVASSAGIPALSEQACFRDAEELLHGLGATQVESMDASQYEGATWCHDLNEPIPVERAREYDTVIDGGTIEHVFNVGQAIVNAMQLVKPGGRLVLDVCCDQECGHGFWQMSPSVAIELFNGTTGFMLERLVLQTNVPLGPRWEYRGSHQGRLEVATPMTTRMLVLAKRQELAGLTAIVWPNQADFAQAWQRECTVSQGSPPLKTSKNLVGEGIRSWMRKWAPMWYFCRSARRNYRRRRSEIRIERHASFVRVP